MPHPPAEDFVSSRAAAAGANHPTKAAGHMVAEIISFGDTAERLLEVMMVVVPGICLATYWDWRAVPLALALFVAIRPPRLTIRFRVCQCAPCIDPIPA